MYGLYMRYKPFAEDVYPLPTLNHGDKLPQWRNKLNSVRFGLNFGETRWAAPLWIGYAGAVATSAASAPVGVGPACPTFVGNSDGNALVGDEGGKWWISVEPTYGGAST